VGALFGAPFEFLLLEFCFGVFAGQNPCENFNRPWRKRNKIRNKVELGGPIQASARRCVSGAPTP
jgi:hypothetical protein